MLLEMKRRLDDPMGTLESWQRENGATLCTDWNGIRCDARGRLTEIKLNGQQLGGTLPDALTDLPFLQEMYVFLRSSAKNA